MTQPSDSFLVTVRSPEKTIWEGSATAVSSENSAGTFDILAEHANFITMLKKEAQLTIVKSDGLKERISASEAILAVMKGHLKIYTKI